jgi:hypothetical protein
MRFFGYEFQVIQGTGQRKLLCRNGIAYDRPRHDALESEQAGQKDQKYGNRGFEAVGRLHGNRN